MSRMISPRMPVFYPSQLALFQQCPERYYHKYIERHRVKEPFSPALARGIAAHRVLAACFEEYRQAQTFPTNLRERIEASLPRLQYPDERSWRGEVDTVLDQVKFGLMQFDGTAEVLAVEGAFDFPYPGNGDCPPFTLRAKVDLVLRHADGGLEHIDHKTGRGQEIDTLQNVAARIVVRQQFPEPAPYVRSTTLFLASQSSRSDELTRVQVQETWREIKALARGTLEAKAWPPVRSTLCEFCPFYGNGCSLDPAQGDGDAMAEWLDGVA